MLSTETNAFLDDQHYNNTSFYRKILINSLKTQFTYIHYISTGLGNEMNTTEAEYHQNEKQTV